MRRDKLKILLEILEICNENDSITNKTKIVYQSNINFKTANIYLEMLIKEGLVEASNSGSREKYHITEKGRELLADLKQIYSITDRYILE